MMVFFGFGLKDFASRYALHKRFGLEETLRIWSTPGPFSHFFFFQRLYTDETDCLKQSKTKYPHSLYIALRKRPPYIPDGKLDPELPKVILPAGVFATACEPSRMLNLNNNKTIVTLPYGVLIKGLALDELLRSGSTVESRDGVWQQTPHYLDEPNRTRRKKPMAWRLQ